MKQVLLFTILILIPLVGAQENTVKENTVKENSSRETSSVTDVEHLAALILGRGENVVFFPGRLPEDLTLPLPEGAQLHGSATVGAENFFVALELQASYGESEKLVGETLLAAGWSRYNLSGPTVFVTGQEEKFPFSQYCSPDRTLAVSANASDTGETTLVLLDIGPYCHDTDQELAPLPRLVLPGGISYYGGGLGQTSDSFEATARYTSSLEAQAIFDDFVAQLEAQGWRAEEASRVESAVSTNLLLELKNERWRGLLTVTDERALLQVARLQ